MNELEFICDTLHALSPHVREAWRRRAEAVVSEKSAALDLVTEVDVNVQREIVQRIGKSFPLDHIMGEELSMTKPPSDAAARCWIIDPIDGTQNFVRGLFPYFAVSIAFAEYGRTAGGGVAIPGLEAVLLAERGGGASLNGAALAVSTTDTVSRALVNVEFTRPDARSQAVGALTPLLETAGKIRARGSAVVELCSVATGDSDAFVHVGLKPWDFAASQLIIEEAGGRVTQMTGEPLLLFAEETSVLATNARLHEPLVKLLAQT